MNLVNKNREPFFTQNSDFEQLMAGPFANEPEKVPRKSSIVRIQALCFFFHWQMAKPFAVQNLNFEQKRGSTFFVYQIH